MITFIFILVLAIVISEVLHPDFVQSVLDFIIKYKPDKIQFVFMVIGALVGVLISGNKFNFLPWIMGVTLSIPVVVVVNYLFDKNK